jgi:hypothetical protein
VSIPTTALAGTAMATSLPDPRSWPLRHETYDGMRRFLGKCLVCGVAFGCVHTVVDRIADSRAPLSQRGAAVPDAPPIDVSAESLPLGGSVASGYHGTPPYGVVDPDPPEPLVFRVIRIPEA